MNMVITHCPPKCCPSSAAGTERCPIHSWHSFIWRHWTYKWEGSHALKHLSEVDIEITLYHMLLAGSKNQLKIRFHGARKQGHVYFVEGKGPVEREREGINGN